LLKDVIYAERTKSVGHYPCKKVIGKNIEFLSKILSELIETFFLGFGVQYGEIYQQD
jgi:hypothetical protein